MIIISMKKTPNLFYFCVMILRCLWGFNNVHGKQQIPISLNYKGKYTSGIKNYEIVFPQRVNKDGSFISHLVQHRHSKRSTTEVEYVFYKIPIGGKDYLIELTPNRKLIAPGAVVEIRKEDSKKLSNQKSFNEINPNKTVWNMFENLEIRKLKNTECHFSGHVKGENISKAALSTCYGLAGFIQIENGFYTIEPVAEHNPFAEERYPHILYQEDGLENSSTCHTIRDTAKAVLDQVVRKRRESYTETSAPMFAETLIVVDKTLINHHGDSDCENYVLTVFNMAHNLFRDASVGMMMTLTVVRLIRLELEDDEMNLIVNENAQKALEYFQKWQYEINPGDDSHPNHHDVALLLTRVNVCYSQQSCGILGLTTIGKGCDPKQSAALCEDSGLRLGYVIAHEIGHLLGADHDSDNSTCTGIVQGGLRTIMHPYVTLASRAWSKCSQAYFKEFFKTAENCFLDEPEEHNYNVQDLLPGAMYNADFQCRHLFTTNSTECEIGSTCNSLNCRIPGYACLVTHTPPAEGTSCGENMWCHNTKCLVVGERPGAIDGSWGEWSPWSDCSRTCGSGVASSVRNCDKPQPAQGGKDCAGDRKRYKICATTPCETGRPSFRDIQCGEFNDWIYPEDGKTHSWKAHYFHEENPCALYCVNEEKVVAALRPRVIDGTTCYRGSRDVCVAGNCMTLPCDLHFGSNAIEDACGICHGDGTECEFTQGIRSLPKLTKALTKLLNVPVGTKNIRVEEMSPTQSRIVVRDKDTKEVYVKGRNLGMFTVPGSQAWLGMINKNQETLHIPGPVTKPLTIWVHRLENVTVKWSMALPAEQQRKPEFTWDFLKWGPCSAKCGPGLQKSDPSCMEEKAGLVEDSFCTDLEMPPAKVRPCEIVKCTPRWMVGDWKYCDSTNSQEKERKRAVYCIKKIGEGEGESQIVPDSECKDPKPHSTEPCENRQKRENTEYNYLDEESMYKSDTSEYALHKKYDDYLKHFAALSVPQKKSETIPFHLVSSPHFRHYFHVLETPEDNSAESGEVVDVNLNSIDNITDHIQNKVSSDFYKDTFSGHQIDVSHITSMKKRKSAHFSMPIENKITKEKMVYEKNGKIQCKGRLRDKRKNNLKMRRSNLAYQSTSCQNKLLKPKTKFSVNNWNIDNYISNEMRKTTSASRNMKKLTPEVVTWHKTPPRKSRKLSEEEAEWRYYFYFPTSPRQKLRTGKFLTSNYETKLMEKSQTTAKPAKKEATKKYFKGFLKKKSSHAKEHLRNSLRSKSKKHARNVRNNYFFSNSFDDNSDKFRNFRGRTLPKDLFFERKNPQMHFKRSSHIKKRNQHSMSYEQLKKNKRSNRKKKKPKLKEITSKLSKDTSGNAYGVETRNYLNNLFRENRQRVTTFRPQKVIKVDEQPVIHSGQVIIDTDSVDDKSLEILFQDEDTEEKLEENNQFPRPPVNENRLFLKGQEVCDLTQTLQRRSCFYRRKNDKTKNRLDSADHISRNSLDLKKKNKQFADSEPEPDNKATTAPICTVPPATQSMATSSSGVSTTRAMAMATTTAAATATTKTMAATTRSAAAGKQGAQSNPATEKSTTLTTAAGNDGKFGATTISSTGRSLLTESSAKDKSKNNTDEEVNSEKSEYDENYDIDEIIPYPLHVETTTEDKVQKKKEKKKKAKEKHQQLMEEKRERKMYEKSKPPTLEDYQSELKEDKELNLTSLKLTSKFNTKKKFNMG